MTVRTNCDVAVVEGDTGMRELLEEILEGEWAFRVCSFDADADVSEIAASNPRVVILDLHPGRLIDWDDPAGLRIAAALRDLMGTERVHIVVVSADQDAGSRHRDQIEQLRLSILVKPFDLNTLQVRLRELLRLGRTAIAGGANPAVASSVSQGI